MQHPVDNVVDMIAVPYGRIVCISVFYFEIGCLRAVTVFATILVSGTTTPAPGIHILALARDRRTITGIHDVLFD